MFVYIISFSYSCAFKRYSLRLIFPPHAILNYRIDETTYIVNPVQNDTFVIKSTMLIVMKNKGFEKNFYNVDFNINKINKKLKGKKSSNLPISAFFELKVDTLGKILDVKFDEWTEEILRSLSIDKKQVFTHLFNFPPKSPLKKGEKVEFETREKVLNVEWNIKKSYILKKVKPVLVYFYTFDMYAENEMRGLFKGKVFLDKNYHFIRKEKSSFEIFSKGKKILWKYREVKLLKISFAKS